MAYLRRIIDDEIDELFASLAALSVEGPRAVGKTETALQRASTVRRLDDPLQASLVRADPARVSVGDPPILIDEWQRVPTTWDAVRRAVDADASPGRFLMTGSASPDSPPTASGAGRIVRLRLRPMSLLERGGLGAVRESWGAPRGSAAGSRWRNDVGTRPVARARRRCAAGAEPLPQEAPCPTRRPGRHPLVLAAAARTDAPVAPPVDVSPRFAAAGRSPGCRTRGSWTTLLTPAESPGAHAAPAVAPAPRPNGPTAAPR
jgi:hypothetical protein